MAMAYGDVKKTPKTCVQCDGTYYVLTAVQLRNQKYCSTTCMAKGQIRSSEARQCKSCGIDYIGRPGSVFCGAACRSKHDMQNRQEKRDDLQAHIKKLLKMSGYDRTELSVDFILSVYDQQGGACALTGLPMTWKAGHGRVQTNLSIDRISALCGYTRDNVQLVCRMANVMKGELSQSDFVAVCRRVISKADGVQ